MNEPLPDRMTGKDLVLQEGHEAGFERELYNNMDLTDRRDRRDSITSFTTNQKYRNGYDLIWGKK